MLTYIFYAILIFFGFLCVIGLLSFAALLDIFVGIFPYLSYVILIVELIVSVICIGKRISAGNGAVKSFFASAFCLFNSAQYLYYQAQETQILVFLATSLILGPIWLVANYVAFRGLLNYGYRDEAKVICARSARLLADDLANTGCMHEYYDPFTGKPIMNGGFINWNILALNMIRELEQV